MGDLLHMIYKNKKYKKDQGPPLVKMKMVGLKGVQELMIRG